MNDDYRRGYLDALHFSSGIALAFERMAKTDAEKTAGRDLRAEIDTYLKELKADHASSDDASRLRLLSFAPELLQTLKQILAAVEQGIEINPRLVLEYRFLVDRAEGRGT